MKITEKKLVFNFSSSRVFAALVYWDKEKSKVVVEEFLERKLFLDQKEDISKKILNEIEFLSKNILKNQNFLEKDFVLTDIAIFLSQPWVDYKIYNFSKEDVQGIQLSKNRLENFLNQRDNFEEDFLVERKIVSIFADGKSLNQEEILNKVAQKVEANLFDIFMNFQEKEFFEYQLSKEFPLLKISFRSFLISFFSYLRKKGEKEDFIFMDSSAELLEIGVFKDEKLNKIILLPFGRNKIISEIQKKMKKDFVESEGFLRMFLNDELEEKQSKKIEKILKAFDKEFKKVLEENFEKDELKIEKKFLVAGNLENQRILRRQKSFENLVLIDKKKMDKDVKFLDSKKWDGFAGIEAWGEFFE